MGARCLLYGDRPKVNKFGKCICWFPRYGVLFGLFGTSVHLYHEARTFASDLA